MSTQFKIFNFNALEIPQFGEYESRYGWIQFGDDNLYPNYLQALLARSGKHNAIVKFKSMMIGGNGLNEDNLSNDSLKFILNQFGSDTLEEIVAKSSYDLEIYGAFALNIVWSKDRKKIASINYIDVSKLRIANPDPKQPGLDQYYLCADWSNTRKYVPTKYDGFNYNKKSNPSQILYVKEYRPGCEWYGQPEYIPGVNWMELEYEISAFHLNEAKGGFAPSMLINFSTGIPSDEEMDLVINRLRKEYEGTTGKKTLFTFSDGVDKAPVITPIQLNNSDERFIGLNKEVTEGVLTAHRVTNPTLFGIRTEGQLGGRSELVESLEIMQSQYINPKQRIIERTINKLANVNGIFEEIKLNKYTLNIAKTGLETADVLSILTSTLSNEQKFTLLVQSGYEEQTAKELVGTQNNTI
jgi:hypothetical protein